MDALTAIQNRRSTRVYGTQKVPRNILESIVDAGRWATTARNVQPWEFVVVTDEGTRLKIGALAENGKFIAKAPACVAVFCQDTKYYLEDGCAATENILIAATALGVNSCWVAGDKKNYCADIAELLKVPAGCRLISLIALGYSESPGTPPPKRPLQEVLHWEEY
ncbi:MAG TPA: nitroreductase family protein [Elusimicrobiota bacterium]|nr:nitroreductase family protein [Elusimicrobiota bacterium]